MSGQGCVGPWITNSALAGTRLSPRATEVECVVERREGKARSCGGCFCRRWGGPLLDRKGLASTTAPLSLRTALGESPP
jgi:hypothetical protein